MPKNPRKSRKARARKPIPGPPVAAIEARQADPATENATETPVEEGLLASARGPWAGAGMAAVAMMLAAGFPAGGQDLPMPSREPLVPAGPNALPMVASLELPVLDTNSLGPATPAAPGPGANANGSNNGSNDGGMMVEPLQVEEMVKALDLPADATTGEEGQAESEKDAEGNPLFGDGQQTAEAADIARSRAISAMMLGGTTVGPFGLSGPFLGFQSGLAITGMYDSNILRTSEEDSQENFGQGPESFVFHISPFARYQSPGPLWYLEAEYSPSYVMYSEFDELNTWDQNANLSLRYQRKEWDAQIRGYYRSTSTSGSLVSQLAREQEQDTVGGNSDSSFDREGYGGQDYGASLRAAYKGAKLGASVGASYNLSDGENRYYGSDIREERYTGDFGLSYRLSPKTRMQLDGGMNYRGPFTPDVEAVEAEPPPPPPPIYVNSLGQQVPPPPGSVVPEPEPVEETEEEVPVVQSFEETYTARMNFAALWSATPLLEFGPGVRATYDSRADGLTSTSIGPLLRARYQLSRKVSLNAQVAAEFRQFEERDVEPVAPPPPPPQPQVILVPDPVPTDPNAPVTPTPVTPAPVVAAPAPEPEPEPDPQPTYDSSNEPFVSTEISGTWTPTDDWGVNLRLARSAGVSSNSREDFREVFSTRGSVSRRIDRGLLTLGAGYTWESVLREQTGGEPAQDREFFSVDMTYSFPIWKDRAFATAFLRYQDNQGGSGDSSWTGYQSGLSIAVTF